MSEPTVPPNATNELKLDLSPVQQPVRGDKWTYILVINGCGDADLACLKAISSVPYSAEVDIGSCGISWIMNDAGSVNLTLASDAKKKVAQNVIMKSRATIPESGVVQLTNKLLQKFKYTGPKPYITKVISVATVGCDL
jgi:hypothetical protein